MISNRLEQYHEKTEPLVDYYEDAGHAAGGSTATLPPDEVAEQIRALLATLKREEEMEM